MKVQFCALSIAMATVAHAEAPKVVTDLPAVHSLVSQVMGDAGTPSLLLEGSADPHSFQMRPSQARSLANADLLVWIGPELTPWLERATEGGSFSANKLTLLNQEMHLHEASDSGDHDDHDDHDDHAVSEEAHGHDDHDDHEGHAHSPDIHAWLDPLTAQSWLIEIAEALSEIDPENAALYGSNALSAQLRIDELVHNVQTQLDQANIGPIVVFHDAYAPFADRFGVTIAGALKEADHAAPSAAYLSELQDTIKESGVACVFLEPQQSNELMDAVIGDQAVGRGVLDPTGGTLVPGPLLYDALIQGLAVNIATCKEG